MKKTALVLAIILTVTACSSAFAFCPTDAFVNDLMLYAAAFGVGISTDYTKSTWSDGVGYIQIALDGGYTILLVSTGEKDALDLVEARLVNMESNVPRSRDKEAAYTSLLLTAAGISIGDASTINRAMASSPEEDGLNMNGLSCFWQMYDNEFDLTICEDR